MGHFGPKNGTSDNSGSALRTFLRFCRMKGAHRYMKILLTHLFSLKAICYCLIGHGRNWAKPLLIGSLNTQGMISFMIATGSLNSQDMIRII